MAGGSKGIEIPVVLNADGSVEGLERLTEGLEKIRAAAQGAGSELDKVGDKGGGGKQAGGSREAEGPSWWESRAGQLTQNVVSAGMTFVERAIPKVFDPYSTNKEKILEMAPTAARLSAQTAAGGMMTDPEIVGTGVDIPEATKKQFIQLIGTLAEEGAKRAGMFELREQRAGRAGTTAMLSEFAAVGVIPDQDAIQRIAESFKQRERRIIGMERAVAEAMGGASDDNFSALAQKQLDSFTSGIPGGPALAAAASKQLALAAGGGG